MLCGTPNERNLRSVEAIVTNVGVPSGGEVPPLLSVNVQPPVLFSLWTLRRVFRSLGPLLRNINTLAGTSDVFVEELDAILTEETLVGCQIHNSDGLGELGAELDDLNKRVEIVVVNSCFEWPEMESEAILGAGEMSDCTAQELFGSNVITDLRVSLVEVNKLGFLLTVIRILSRAVISPLGLFFFLFLGVTYELGIVSRVHE